MIKLLSPAAPLRIVAFDISALQTPKFSEANPSLGPNLSFYFLFLHAFPFYDSNIPLRIISSARNQGSIIKYFLHAKSL